GLSFDSMSTIHYYTNVSRSWGSPDSTESWVMNAEGTELLYDTPIHEEVTAWYTDLLESRVAPRQGDYVQDTAASLFVAGLNATHASVLHNTVAFPIQIGDAFEIGAILLPVGPEGRQGTGYEGNQFMINANSDHPE